MTGWRHRILPSGSRFKALLSLIALLRSRVWYTIGAPKSNPFLETTARILRKPRVVHWVGTDIQVAQQDSKIAAALNAPHILHLAEAEWTANEVRALGFDAHIAPLPPRLTVRELPPLPEVFTVLLYIPQIRADLYGRSECERLISNLCGEKIRFVIVGGGSLETSGNTAVENLGRQSSMEKIYARSSALLRIPQHDGLSLMVLESLLLGRHVIWSQEFPFVTTVRTYESVEKATRELAARHLQGNLSLQVDASRFITERYGKKRCLQDIADAWGRSIDGTREKIPSSLG